MCEKAVIDDNKFIGSVMCEKAVIDDKNQGSSEFVILSKRLNMIILLVCLAINTAT